jgi:hypothetical protein
MNRHLLAALLVLAVMMAASLAAIPSAHATDLPPVEMIQNGGFEILTYPEWQAWSIGGTYPPTTTSPGHTGSYAANLTATGTGGQTSTLGQGGCVNPSGCNDAHVISATTSFAVNPNTNSGALIRVEVEFSNSSGSVWTLRYVFSYTNPSLLANGTACGFGICAYFDLRNTPTNVWSVINRNVYSDAMAAFGSNIWSHAMRQAIFRGYLAVTGTATVLIDDVSLLIADPQYTMSFRQTGSGTAPTVTYHIDSGTPVTDTIPFDVSVDENSVITYAYESSMAGASGIQYVLTDTSPTSPQTVTSDLTVTGTYTTQFYITVTSPHGSPTSSSWVDSGQGLSTSVTSPDGDYVCDGYKIDGGAVVPGVTYDFTAVDSPHTIEYVWHGSLDHFVFSHIDAQTVGVPFSITITAVDAYGNTVTDYSNTNVLDPATGAIDPPVTSGFTSGVWTGNVTLSAVSDAMTLGTTGNIQTEIVGTSNPFVVSGNPYIASTVNTDSPAYAPGSTVTFTGRLTDTGNPIEGVRIVVTVIDPNGGFPVFMDASSITNETGYYTNLVPFTLDSSAPLGTYMVFAMSNDPRVWWIVTQTTFQVATPTVVTNEGTYHGVALSWTPIENATVDEWHIYWSLNEDMTDKTLLVTLPAANTTYVSPLPPETWNTTIYVEVTPAANGAELLTLHGIVATASASAPVFAPNGIEVVAATRSEITVRLTLRNVSFDAVTGVQVGYLVAYDQSGNPEQIIPPIASNYTNLTLPATYGSESVYTLHYAPQNGIAPGHYEVWIYSWSMLPSENGYWEPYGTFTPCVGFWVT